MAKVMKACCWSQSGCGMRDISFPGKKGSVILKGTVGLNGNNYKSEVSAIQSALNDVSIANGGPATALKVDDICGPKTKAAIYGFQFHNHLVTDSVIHPNKATLEKLNEIRRGKTPVLPVNDAIVRIYSALALATHWTYSAQRSLDGARDYILRLDRLGFAKTYYERVNSYFKLDHLGSSKQQIDAISRISSTFLTMRTVIGHHGPTTMVGSGVFQVDPTSDNKTKGPYSAFTFFGGWTRRDPKTGLPKHSAADGYEGADFREDAIYIATNMVTSWSDFAIATLIIHELAHFVGPELDHAGRIGDVAYSNVAKFKTLTHWEAIRNAESYAMFANHCGLGNPFWYVGQV